MVTFSLPTCNFLIHDYFEYNILFLIITEFLSFLISIFRTIGSILHPQLVRMEEGEGAE